MIPKEDIISMARRTGASIQWTAGVPPAPVALSMSWQQLERFAELAAEYERDACARYAEHYMLGTPEGHEIASFLRFRNKPQPPKE